jgi:hypothetical protein
VRDVDSSPGAFECIVEYRAKYGYALPSYTYKSYCKFSLKGPFPLGTQPMACDHRILEEDEERVDESTKCPNRTDVESVDLVVEGIEGEVLTPRDVRPDLGGAPVAASRKTSDRSCVYIQLNQFIP